MNVIDVVLHGTAISGALVGAGLAIRIASGPLLRLVAGLVAILAPSERSRADRALEVLRLEQKILKSKKRPLR